jgi:hypothetical protein
MTRRKFIQTVLKIGSAIIIGSWSLAKKAAPRKFVRAVQLKKYPGQLRSFGRIYKQSKWSG